MTGVARLSMRQQEIIREMQRGRPGPNSIINPTASVLERHGLIEWHFDASRAHGGKWALTEKGKSA